MKTSLHFSRHSASGAASGFTLVEMLVATGLVMLIMTLFAQIYGSAIGTITEQRGMGNNDQKARVLTTVLHNDLNRMSYRQTSKSKGSAGGIVPLTLGDAGNDGVSGIIDLDNQLGYFYLSENDPWDASDDVLQFTTVVDAADPEDYYVGKAVNLGIDNDPEEDDGSVNNGISQSQYAEVSYFLRQGTLYRRVLLLRDNPSTTLTDEQPGDASANRTYAAGSANYTGGSFWNSFDYSATRSFFSPAVGGSDSSLWFHGKKSLSNANSSPDSQPLGLPWNRFGHLNDQRTTGNINHGQPREYLQAGSTDEAFIGRYTQMETSSPTMSYPGNDTATGFYTLFNRSDASLTYDYTNGGISGMTNGPRFGEDILLTNVEAFDIEVWEPSSLQYVQLGHDGGGTFAGPGQNTGYGPRTSGNNIFETWHPAATVASNNKPPHRPVNVTTTLQPWAANTSYAVDDMIRVPGLNDGGTPTPTYSNSLYYKAIVAGTSATTGSGPSTMIPNDTETDGSVTWKCIDNRIGLRGIKITIRYIDINSRLPRQVTVVHSFAE